MSKFGQMLGQAGIGLAEQGASGLMGLVLGGINDKRQIKQQEKLIGMQLGADMKMTDYNYAKQLQMWKDTSYDAQIEQMKKAGVNPALLYGMSGGGGQTTGSGSGASVHAPAAPSGGGEIMGMMALRTQQAQIDLMRAQAAKTEAEKDKLKGVDTQEAQTRILDLTQGISNKRAVEQLTYTQNRIAEANAEIMEGTVEESIATIGLEMQIAQQTVNRLVRENYIGHETKETTIKQIKTNLLQTTLENALIKEQTNLTREEANAIATRLTQEWAKIGLHTQDVITNRINATTNTDRANTEWSKNRYEQWKNDVQESTKIATETITKIMQALVISGGNTLKR